MTARVWLVVLLTGCVGVDSTTRTERGPLLRTFQRPLVLEGNITAEAAVEWPKLNLSIAAADVCRDETVEEYAEEHITERSMPSAGAALATGIATVLASGVLLGLSYAFPNTPDTRSIDAAGRYGASLRQTLQGVSLGSAIVGVPALVVGVIGTLRSGVDVQSRRAEQVTSQRDVPCHARGVDGPLVVRSLKGERSAPFLVKAGRLTLSPTDVVNGVDELRFADTVVVLGEEAQRTIDAFVACAQYDATQTRFYPEPMKLEVMRARACREVRPDVQRPASEAEVQRLRDEGNPGGFPPVSAAATFEEAVAGMAPKLKFSAESPDVAKLDDAEALTGQAVFIVGVVERVISPNIGVLQLGERRVFLFIPSSKPWGGDFGVGSRVEVVAVMAGVQAVGEQTLPVARAGWMRSAF